MAASTTFWWLLVADTIDSRASEHTAISTDDVPSHVLNWADKHYIAVLDHFQEMKLNAKEILGSRWIAKVRIRYEHDSSEFMFVFLRRDVVLYSTYIYPSGASIYEQLLSIGLSDPGIESTRIAASINVIRGSTDSDKCGKLNDLSDRLEHMNASLVQGNSECIDCVQYEFLSATLDRTIHLTVSGRSSELAKWSEEMREVLMADCSSSNEPSPRPVPTGDEARATAP